jgi:hypothetical protein
LYMHYHFHIIIFIFNMLNVELLVDTFIDQISSFKSKKKSRQVFLMKKDINFHLIIESS